MIIWEFCIMNTNYIHFPVFLGPPPQFLWIPPNKQKKQQQTNKALVYQEELVFFLYVNKVLLEVWRTMVLPHT